MQRDFTLLLAGFSRTYAAELVRAVSANECCRVRIAADYPAAEKLLRDVPEAVLSELILPGGDGFSLLEKKDLRTRFVVLTYLSGDALHARALRMGAAAVLQRPMAAERAAEAVFSVLCPTERTGTVYAGNAASPRIRPEPLLDQLSLPRTLDGFRYLSRAAELCARDRELLCALTLRLYPAVAREMGTTAACVEKSMRYAVERIFDRADVNVLERFFGFSVGPERDRPTLGAFLAQMAIAMNTMGTDAI